MTFDWTFVLLALFITSIFVADGVRRSWRENEWKRRWRREQ
jgi:hypothetical protein